MGFARRRAGAKKVEQAKEGQPGYWLDRFLEAAERIGCDDDDNRFKELVRQKPVPEKPE